MKSRSSLGFSFVISAVYALRGFGVLVLYPPSPRALVAGLTPPQTPMGQPRGTGYWEMAGSVPYRGSTAIARREWSLSAIWVLTGLGTSGLRQLVETKTITETALEPGEIGFPSNWAFSQRRVAETDSGVLFGSVQVACGGEKLGMKYYKYIEERYFQLKALCARAEVGSGDLSHLGYKKGPTTPFLIGGVRLNETKVAR